MGLRAAPWAALLALALLAPGELPARELARSALLVSYDFDEAELPTGPDTFTVLQDGQSRVQLSRRYRFSGQRSLEIRDVPGDGAFPDFLGHLPLRREGALFAHFAWMVATPEQTLNIGLLGPQWCSIVKDGISFWLALEGGTLFHVSGRRSHPLFRPEPFRWYLFDLFYDIGAGRYDLLVHEGSSGRVLAEVRGSPNPAGVPGSAVFKFSFAGDLLHDASAATYYVDDVVISVDSPVAQPPFAAPGRRRLFIERWQEHHARLRDEPRCLPPLELADLGFEPHHVGALQWEGALDALRAIFRGGPVEALPPGSRDPEVDARLEAARSWGAGCASLARGELAAALAAFRRAAQRAPSARLYPLSAVLALAGLERWAAADAGLAEISGAWRDDERWPAVMAWLGARRGDLERARDWLERPAQSALEEDSARLDLIADQYFFVLLWSDRAAQAERYAHRRAHRLHELGLPVWKWMERAADAAFVRGRLDEARHRYHVALHRNPHPTAPLLKLSDVYHAAGDAPREREYREMVYGSLAASH